MPCNVGYAHVAVGVVPIGKSQSVITALCQSEGQALGKCLVNAGKSHTQIHSCAPSFLLSFPSKLGPNKYDSYEGMENNDRRGSVNKCWRQNILTGVIGCTSYVLLLYLC